MSEWFCVHTTEDLSEELEPVDNWSINVLQDIIFCVLQKNVIQIWKDMMASKCWKKFHFHVTIILKSGTMWFNNKSFEQNLAKLYTFLFNMTH